MKNIEIKIDKNTRMVDLSKTIIGNDSENLQGKIVFSFVEDFVNGQARLHYEINGEKKWVALDKVEETYELPIKSVLTKKGQIDMQLVITEGVEEENVPVFKSNKFYMYCNSSINAIEEEPIGYDSWIEIANTKLNQVDNLDVNLENNILTVTKKDGSTQSQNVKGDSYEITEEDYKKIEENIISKLFVSLTQREYDALEVKDENTYYFIIEEE